MARGSASVVLATGCISVATAGARAGLIAPRELAATPTSIVDGRVWLLATSAILADRPALASIVGFLIVGLVAVRLCAPRVAWTAAASGHIFSAVIVYAALGVARLVDPSALGGVQHLSDYGTSAIIAAWIGAVAYRLWALGRPIASLLLVSVSALLGWYCKGTLTLLDTEHAVALAFGIGVMRLASRPEPFRAPSGLRRAVRRLVVVMVGATRP
jgi:hypothetical protein